MGKILIQGGTILSMDPGIGDIIGGDVLIEDDRILAVGENLDAPDAEVIDARNRIVMPGLINAHLHTWETALRGIGGDWGRGEYFRQVHPVLAPLYTAEDTYLGNFMGIMNQINSGTTTLFDWCHNNATPAHSDAAIDALFDTGIRAVFGHGTVKPDPKEGEPHYSQIPHPADEIKRLRTGRLSDDGALVTLALAFLGPDYSTWEVTLHDFRLAKEYGLLSSTHIWGREDRLVKDGYHRLAKEGLLGPDHNLVHGNYLGDEELKVIVDSGVSITATPSGELQANHGEPLTGRVISLGGRPSIGADFEIYTSADMFYVMRYSLQTQRIFDNKEAARKGDIPNKRYLKARDALEWATINNAIALQKEDQIGSLSPGKQADIILIRTNDLNMIPVNNPASSVVLQATAANVDTVLIAGQKMKEKGKLLYPAADLGRKKAALIESSRRLHKEGGMETLAGI